MKIKMAVFCFLFLSWSVAARAEFVNLKISFYTNKCSATDCKGLVHFDDVVAINLKDSGNESSQGAWSNNFSRDGVSFAIQLTVSHFNIGSDDQFYEIEETLQTPDGTSNGTIDFDNPTHLYKWLNSGSVVSRSGFKFTPFLTVQGKPDFR
jgi:hypothetical protein